MMKLYCTRDRTEQEQLVFTEENLSKRYKWEWQV